jgi:hypothetical protein
VSLLTFYGQSNTKAKGKQMTDGPELNFRRLDIKLQVRDLQLRCEVIPVTAEKDFPTKDVFSA